MKKSKRSSAVAIARRKTSFGHEPVNYAAVGCTLAADVLAFPPAGFRARYHERKLGSGEERFRVASESLMSWGIHLGMGKTISHIRSETQQQSIPGGHSSLSSEEIVYSSGGREFIAPGMTVSLSSITNPARLEDFRIVSVENTQNASWYIMGTVTDSAIRGEWRYGVERRADDTVWFTLISVTQLNQEKPYRWRRPLSLLQQLAAESQATKSLLATRMV